MKSPRTNRIRMEMGRREFIGASALILLCGLALSLSSQNITLTTSYPAPSGVYAQIITTGGDPANPQDTILARDRGRVLLSPNAAGVAGIGTNAPQATVQLNGATIPNALDVNGPETANLLLARGARTYLLGGDPAFHWIMAGGTDEPDKNALGFNLPAHTVQVGPNWTFVGAGGQATNGSFGIDCHPELTGPTYPQPTNCPGGTTATVTIPTTFRPTAAHCSPATDGYTNSWFSLVCPSWNYVLGPNYVQFTATLAYGDHTYKPTGLLNYIIVGQ